MHLHSHSLVLADLQTGSQELLAVDRILGIRPLGFFLLDAALVIRLADRQAILDVAVLLLAGHQAFLEIPAALLQKSLVCTGIRVDGSAAAAQHQQENQETPTRDMNPFHLILLSQVWVTSASIARTMPTRTGDGGSLFI